jgi:hypothetical protein
MVLDNRALSTPFATQAAAGVDRQKLQYFSVLRVEVNALWQQSQEKYRSA